LKRLASITVLLLLLIASSILHLTIYLVKAAEPTSTDAQIKNITYQNTVSIGTSILITVSVQNYACGILGADLVVIDKMHMFLDIFPKSKHSHSITLQLAPQGPNL